MIAQTEQSENVRLLPAKSREVITWLHTVNYFYLLT